MLEIIPPAPETKKGWPWTEESSRYFGKYGVKISIIIPSYNQGQFLEGTLRSVILQNYSQLEIIVIDGGSTDNSLEIISKYNKWITYWISEADSGQSDAINKGFKKATGTLVNWICSDDMLCKDAINRFISDHYVGEKYLYIGSCLLMDVSGNVLGKTVSTISSFEELVDIKNNWRKDNSIAQPASLYPISALKAIGGLNPDLHYCMDFELWGKLIAYGIEIKNISCNMGIFRIYPSQKTANTRKSTIELIKTSKRLIKENDNLGSIHKVRIIISIDCYHISFIYHEFRSWLGIKRTLKRYLKHGI